MARPSENIVRLYLRPGRSGRQGVWWADIPLRDEDLLYLQKQPGFLKGRELRRDRRGHLRISLGILEGVTDAEKKKQRSKADELIVALKKLIEQARALTGGQPEFDDLLRRFRAGWIGESSDVRVTVHEYFDRVAAKEKASAARWVNPVDAKKKGAISPGTVKDRALLRKYFLNYLAEQFAGKAVWLHQIETADVKGFLRSMQAAGKQKPTLRKVKDYLSGIWEDARTDRPSLCKENPWKAPREETRDDDDADEDKLTLLHEETLRTKARELYRLPSNFDNNGIIFMLLTGCRPSDTCWIGRGDIDWERSVIKGLQSKVGRYKPIPITAALKPILQRQLAAHDSIWLFAYKEDDQTEWHQPDRIQVAKRWNRELDRIFGEKNVTCKTLRYTFRTAGEQLLVPEKILDRLMGHKKGKTMGDFYSHHNLAVLAEAAAKIQGHLVGTIEEQNAGAAAKG